MEWLHLETRNSDFDFKGGMDVDFFCFCKNQAKVSIKIVFLLIYFCGLLIRKTCGGPFGQPWQWFALLGACFQTTILCICVFLYTCILYHYTVIFNSSLIHDITLIDLANAFLSETKFFYKLLLKPLMFMCPLFCEFCETNKTMKLKGVNSNTIPTLISVGCWKSAVGSWLNDWFTCEQAGCE